MSLRYRVRPEREEVRDREKGSWRELPKEAATVVEKILRHGYVDPVQGRQ